MTRSWRDDVIGGLAAVVGEPGRPHDAGSFGLLAGGGVAALGASPNVLVARKKKKNKKKKNDEPLDVYDWFDSWNTTLSNGVKGIATFGLNGFLEILGTYSNSVGSGTFTCVSSD